jgi:aminoglycoside/choline kinase family phosphotransferase
VEQLDIPRHHEEISRQWLTLVLRRAGLASTIAAFEWDRSVAQGLKSDIARVRLRYDPPNADAPDRLIVKLSSRIEQMRTRQPTRLNYLREVQFYRDLQPLIDLPTPRCYHADVDLESGYHVIVLEDLAPATSGLIANGCTPTQAERAVHKLGRFHAYWWQRPQLEELPWLQDEPAFDRDALAQAHEGWWPTFVDKAGHHLPAPMIELGARLGDQLAGIMTRCFLAAPRTLRHGDYSVTNMMFATAVGGAPFTIIDWQTLGRGKGPWDLAWFLGQSLTIEQRRAAEPGLLRAYHETLLDGGVEGYSFDQCLRDYQLALLQRFGSLVSSVVALPFTDDQKQQLIEVLVPRNVAAITDHGAQSIAAFGR